MHHACGLRERGASEGHFNHAVVPGYRRETPVLPWGLLRPFIRRCDSLCPMLVGERREEATSSTKKRVSSPDRNQVALVADRSVICRPARTYPRNTQQRSPRSDFRSTLETGEIRFFVEAGVFEM